MSGILYGVGVGPGDPELLTIKAIRAIENADIIIAPKTEKKENSVALEIAMPYLKANVQVHKMVFPMVFNQDELNEAWINNRNEIVSFLAEGKKVVFLTLGDPMFYSTFIYIFKLLKDCDYPVESIPGITAFCAIGSKMGYPLAEGNEILSIIPATAPQENIVKAMQNTDNVVLMKVYKNYDDIVGVLDESKLLSKAVMISKCGLPDETIITNLQEAVGSKKNYLSTILTRRGE